MTTRLALAVLAVTGAAAGGVATLAADGDRERSLVTGAGRGLTATDRAITRPPPLPTDPSHALATTDGLTAVATAQSHCLRSRHGAYCVDTSGLTDDSPQLPVRRAGFVGVRLGATGRKVAAWVARVEDGLGRTRISPLLMVTRLDRRGLRWVVQLPEEVPAERAALRFEVRYRDFHGEPVSFDIKLRPVTPP